MQQKKREGLQEQLRVAKHAKKLYHIRIEDEAYPEYITSDIWIVTRRKLPQSLLDELWDVAKDAMEDVERQCEGCDSCASWEDEQNDAIYWALEDHGIDKSEVEIYNKDNPDVKGPPKGLKLAGKSPNLSI